MGDLLPIAIFKILYFSFISFSLVLPMISTISNIRYFSNIITVTLLNMLFPFTRLLSDNPISTIGTRVFSISKKELFM